MRHFVFLAFVNMAASNLHKLQAALSLPLERLGEVHRHAIFRTPIPSLLGGLLSENEVGQLFFAPGHLSNSENDVLDCQRIAAAIALAATASAASHILKSSFVISKEDRLFTHLADFFESFAVLMRAAYTVLADTSWA